MIVMMMMMRSRMMEMKSGALVRAGALLLLLGVLSQTRALKDAPTVNIYTETPVEYGVKNTLICHCSGFHPPLIDMRLKKDQVELQSCEESDLSFQRDWKYFKSKYVSFIPEKGGVYTCDVTHDNGKTQTYQLEVL